MSEHNKDQLSQKQRRRKNRLEWGAAILVGLGLLALTLVQREVLDLGPGLSDSQGIIALVSINFSVLLLTLLIILVLRNLYRIFFERQAYGSLQTKMVVAFISLSLLPTILIFYYSYRLIVSGHDLWFSPKIEEALSDSLKLSEATLELDNRLLAVYGGDIFDALKEKKLNLGARNAELRAFLEDNRQKFHLTLVEFYSPNGQMLERAGEAGLAPIYHDWFGGQYGGAPPWLNVVESDRGDLVRLVWPLLPPSVSSRAEALGYLAIGRLTLTPIRSRMEDVRHGIISYQNALDVQKPFRVTQLTALAGVALLAVFISVWIGAHLARSLTQPVLELVEGTKRVAQGDLDFTLVPASRAGELADLVASFNQMTRDLKAGYAELDSRRRFVETVLRSVSTGVVVVAPDGEVTSINQAARDILGEPDDPEEVVHELPQPLMSLVEEAARSQRRGIERPVRLSLGDRVISLRVYVAPLRSEEDRDLGHILAFDDLTELERAQRLAAWREVARRIAHEVKNPLTPIQLAAQRLRRRFSQRLAEEPDAQIFDECTQVIIRQVDEMQTLVDEFSRFARLPEIKTLPGDLTAFLKDSLALFRQAHKGVEFILTVKEAPPVFAFDPEQLRRVLTNILENAVAAMNGQGRVELLLEVDELAGARLTISDTGPGLDPAMQSQIFEPYVTTKTGGQGLGLAIARTIVNDHGGFIKAKNQPEGGAVFTIELPLRQ